DEILPSVVPSLTNANRSEELNTWRHPVDLVKLLAETDCQLAEALDRPRDGAWNGMHTLSEVLLGEDPFASAEALMEALRSGAQLTAITRALSYTAAVRVAKFHTSNEFSDWITVLHT